MKGAIMLSGGGSGKLFAAIGVTYPAGSTLTCTNGTKTLTAKTTSGQWVFAIPEPGTWTVMSGDRSEDIEITAEGQFETVNIASFYVFKSGSGFAEGYSLIGTSYAYPSIYDWSPNITDEYIENSDGGDVTWGVAEPIDLSEYKTLKARVLLSYVGLNNGAKMILGVSTTVLEGTTSPDMEASSEIGSESVNKETVISLDISNINGSYYVNWDMNYTKNKVYDLWLE